MVHIRVHGRPRDVDATTELLCRIAAVSEVSRPAPARTGGVIRYVTASVDLDEDETCRHSTARVVSRQPVPGPGHVVEYGHCEGCGERVARLVDSGRNTAGDWSAFTPVEAKQVGMAAS